MTQEEIRIEIAALLLDTDQTTESKLTTLVATACKDDSIAFGEWIVARPNLVRTHNKSGEYRWWDNETIIYYTTAQLYDIFHNENGRK